MGSLRRSSAVRPGSGPIVQSDNIVRYLKFPSSKRVWFLLHPPKLDSAAVPVSQMLDPVACADGELMLVSLHFNAEYNLLSFFLP